MIKEEALSSRQKYLKILSNLTPAGAVGVSLLVLGAAVPAAASVQPGRGANLGDPGRTGLRTARRNSRGGLGGCRGGPGSHQPEQQLSWWCNGGGCGWGWRGRAWGFPNWGNGFPNFRNWGNGLG